MGEGEAQHESYLSENSLTLICYLRKLRLSKLSDLPRVAENSSFYGAALSLTTKAARELRFLSA